MPKLCNSLHTSINAQLSFSFFLTILKVRMSSLGWAIPDGGRCSNNFKKSLAVEDVSYKQASISNKYVEPLINANNDIEMQINSPQLVRID